MMNRVHFVLLKIMTSDLLTCTLYEVKEKRKKKKNKKKNKKKPAQSSALKSNFCSELYEFPRRRFTLF